MAIAIEAVPIGLVAVAGRTWRHRGRQLLTAIVKVTFEIQHDGDMKVTPPAPIVGEERHHRGSPIASLVRASDLALLVPQPEVVIVGSAYAAAGQRTPSTTVRFAVQRDATMLISKRLDVSGDRRALPGSAVPPPLPFERVPILYERALGGIASRENPVGIGLSPESDGLMSYPNINLPTSGGVAPAGFGPIPSAWPARQQKRGSMPWAAANTHPDADVPDDFDDGYFQTAPADQRTMELLAGDLIAIVNMHPEIGTLRTYLPASRGVALAQTAAGERIPLSLRIDTVHLEPDAMRAEIIYRGALPLQARHSGVLWLAGALETPEQRMEFPDLSSFRSEYGRSPRAHSGADFSGTLVLEPPESRPMVGAKPAHGHSGTMVIEPEPAPRREPAVAAPPPVEPAKKHGGTMIIEAEVQPQSLPFAKRKRRPSGERTAVRNQVGTPWADSKPSPAQPALDALESTLLDEVTAVPSAEVAPPPAAPPPAAPPPAAAPPAAPPPAAAQPAPQPAPELVEASPSPKGPWRDDPPPSAVKAPARPAPVQRADFKAGLYKKFKR